ncbi:MAG: 50S ribosomal protein L10 [Pseudomonadota bacterium]|jgi:large subunit ribosomal protein L10|nr:50S ribosomal protein L10 [Alphaproteobacteria bacterium]
MDRMQKEALVADMRNKLESSSLVVVARQSGLTVEEVTGLRRNMRAANAEFKVLKNTLAQIAVQGTKLEGLKEMLVGPTALAYSVDSIAAAKALVEFANKNDKVEVVGACLDGKVLQKAEVKALATLPSLDELRSKLIAIINAPATKLATLLQEPASRVARVITAKNG